jgi:ABC-type lipoprotein release transport system permease subunit
MLFRLLSGLLFGMTARDPPVYAVSIAALVGSGLLACSIPAWQAAHSDPATVLREE